MYTFRSASVLEVSSAHDNVSVPCHSGSRSICVFSPEKYGGKDKMDPMEKSICLDREGFYGWFGLGGSVLHV